jgi:HEPN domain-containing protein
MPKREHVITVVREWVSKAENDLTTAAHTLKLGANCPTDTVCFHAQQVVEKYLKALLTWRAMDFPKTHSVEELLALLPPTARPKLSEVDQERLTAYATVTRYPGNYEPISLAEARRAVAVARRFRGEVRKLLPKEAFRVREK